MRKPDRGSDTESCTKTHLTRRQTPEERELGVKEAELSLLQAELAQRELDLATLQGELRAFESRYVRIVGIRYAELDELTAQLAEAAAKARPTDNAARAEASKARIRAEETARQTKGVGESDERQKFKPSEELKKLYRDIAKQVHPDLSTDGEERERRQRLMAEANLAYESGDQQALKRILEEWESSPESIKGEGTVADLIRVIRKIDQIRKRLGAIDRELAGLRQSELFRLKTRVEEAEATGRDLLTEIARALNRQIAEARHRLETRNRAPSQ